MRCANYGIWWRTGRPGVLQSMGLQRVGHDWVNNNNYTSTKKKKMWLPCKSGQWSLLMRAGRGLPRRCSILFRHQAAVNIFKFIKLSCLVHWTPECGDDVTISPSKPFTSPLRENRNQRDRGWYNMDVKIWLSFAWRPFLSECIWVPGAFLQLMLPHSLSSPPWSLSPMELF